MKEHDQVKELLAVYRDLDDTDRRRVDRHMNDCATCAARLSDYQAMDRSLAELTELQPDARLREAFYAIIGERRAASGWFDRTRSLLQMPKLTGQFRIALLASVMLLILLATIEAAHLFQSYRAVQRSAREAVQWAITYEPQKGYHLDGTPCALDEDCYNETDQEYLERRTRLIKEMAIDQAGGLRLDKVEVWGYPHFTASPTGWTDADLRDQPGAPGLPVRVRVTSNVELADPIFRALVPQVQLTADVEMINEGTQSGAGNFAPPPVLPSAPSLSSPATRVGDEALLPSLSPVLIVSSVPDERPVIQTATFDLEVDNIDQALYTLTQVVGDMQGYIVSQRVWYDGEAKFATITLAVPVQDFENALRRLRGLATRVVNEQISGEDVSDQYVDLGSRLRNLEATRDRIRGFLRQAQSVEEALQVNRELSAIEDQIEQVQGRLNYLDDKTTFSIVTVNLNPRLLPPQAEGWQPSQMVEKAAGTLVDVGQIVFDVFIWVVLVLGPFFVAVYVLIGGLRLLVRWLRRKASPL